MKPNLRLKFSDLTPMAQACWDRDGIPEWIEQCPVGTRFDLCLDGDGVVTVFSDVIGERYRGTPWWFEFVETPEPRWRSNIQAREEGYVGVGHRDIR